MEERTSIYVRQVLSEPLTRSVTGAVTLPPPLKKLALKLYYLPLIQFKQIKFHPFVTDQSPHLCPNPILFQIPDCGELGRGKPGSGEPSSGELSHGELLC